MLLVLLGAPEGGEDPTWSGDAVAQMEVAQTAVTGMAAGLIT
jgi:hypothetical protein